MNISVEISYYPLHEEYKPPIIDFIKRIHCYSSLKIQTNGMSTQIFGDYSEVMHALQSEIEKSFALPHSVFILKIVNADLQVIE